MNHGNFSDLVCRNRKVLVSFFLIIMTAITVNAQSGFIQATALADISGIAWIRDDLFLVVHDAKNPETLARVSFLKIPTTPEGIFSKPLDVQFPEFNSNDFEGIARIPGTDQFLLAESTEELAEKPYSGRIFLAEVKGESLKINDVMRWPARTKNIEGTAIAQIAGKLFFLFAERSHGKNSTEIQIAELRLNPLRFENLKTVGTFVCPYPTGKNTRPVSALAFDASGTIYAASAEDPDDDNGPFSSAVYQIGKIVQIDAEAKVTLAEKASLVARLDGMKVEGLAIRERPGKQLELFVGLDDENYGGTVRQIKINSGTD